MQYICCCAAMLTKHSDFRHEKSTRLGNGGHLALGLHTIPQLLNLICVQPLVLLTLWRFSDW